MKPDEYSVGLPLDVVELIANCLLAVDVVDYISFRAVCHDWRSRTASPTGFASKFRPRRWIMLPSFGNNPAPLGCFLNIFTGRSLILNRIPELESYSLIAVCDGLLVLLDKDTLIMHIFNPFTRHMSDGLPPLESKFGFTVEILSDFELLRRYCTIMISDVSPHPVLMLCLLCGNTFFAKPQDMRWNYKECQYMHIVTNTFFEGKFYYIDQEDDKICAMDPDQQDLNASLVPLLYDVDDSPSVLVKFDSDLLLVRWIGEPLPENFEIFRVDLESNILIRLDNLGECSLISGVNRQTIIIPSKSFPSLKGNSIYYFLVDSRNSIYYPAMPSDHAQTVVYSLHDQSFQLLSYFHDDHSFQPRTLVDYLFKYCSIQQW